MNPKVLVGAPVCDLYEYCFDEFLDAIIGLNYDNYDILLVDNSKDDKYFNYIKECMMILLSFYKKIKKLNSL